MEFFYLENKAKRKVFLVTFFTKKVTPARRGHEKIRQFKASSVLTQQRFNNFNSKGFHPLDPDKLLKKLEQNFYCYGGLPNGISNKINQGYP